jgi:acyl-coenzyme A thioesterase PaaI-like protein
MEDEWKEVFFSKAVANVKIEHNEDEFIFRILEPDLEDMSIEYVEFSLPVETAERMAHGILQYLAPKLISK